MSIKELQKKIKSVPKSYLNGLSESESKIFSNYKLFPIDILVKADWNYKTEDEERSNKLQGSLKRYGQIESMHVRELETGYYEVVNGNHRLDDMKKLGQQFIIAYDHGEITEAEAKRIAIQTNELKFDADPLKLGTLLNELRVEFGDDDFDSSIYIDPKILDKAELTFNRNDELNNNILDEDKYQSDGNSIVKSERGDLYELNNHRLLVGDSTNEEDVSRLMNGKKAHMLFTDPPYNVNYIEQNQNRPTKKGGKDWNENDISGWTDYMTDEEYIQFLKDFLKNAKQHLIEYGHYYVWYASKYFPELKLAFMDNDIPFDGVPIIWYKQVAPMTYAHYRKRYEPCLFGGKDSVTGNSHEGKKRWFGEVMDDNVWEELREHNVYYVHPTQKPLGLAMRAMRNSSQAGELVLDLFGGSGSTLIASEKYDRVCHTMEYEPRFADEIVKRYMHYCEKNNIECKVLRNGEEIDISFFEDEEGQDE